MTVSRLLLVLAALSALLACDAWAQRALSAGSAAQDCARRLAEAEGGASLASACPELAAEIERGVWADALGDSPADGLAARPLRELLGMIAHYEEAAVDGALLGFDELDAIVESLGPLEPVVELSLWDMLLEWIKERLGLGDSTSEGGLLEWLRNLPIPEEWIRTLVYVLGFTVVIAALIVAANELRVSGVLRGGGQPGRVARMGLVDAWTSAVPRTLDAVRKAPVAHQPVLLLALIVDKLRARYGNEVRDSMTHRELAAAAETLGLEHGGDLVEVVTAAERVTYASWRPEAADVEPVLSRGKAVLDELDAAPPSMSRGSA